MLKKLNYNVIGYINPYECFKKTFCKECSIGCPRGRFSAWVTLLLLEMESLLNGENIAEFNTYLCLVFKTNDFQIVQKLF